MTNNINCKPFTEFIRPRCDDLLVSISSCICSEKLDRETIARAKLWARELCEQIDLIDTMLIYGEKG